MCVLCVVQRWSRRAAAMLPWLVVPLVALWALSQLLLPPGLRLEATSPRLACVLVLLATLFWYEVLVPRISIWRSQRSARILEQRISRAAELAELRRSATRRCRNCRNPYRDQNPAGGRFMCSLCGHVSKRPVLDLPETPTNAGASWGGACSPLSAAASAGRKIASLFFAPSDRGSSGNDGKGSPSSKKGAPSESKAERARRKAEEKKQARLEREMLEEEDRKQREEVAKLIVERRKLRDEVSEAEKESLRRSAPVAKRDSRKGVEKVKEKGLGSSKSNSDVEDSEKRSTRECEGKRAFDKKIESERQGSNVSTKESYRPHISAQVKGSLMSPSRGFGGASFFTRSAQTSEACATRASRHSNGFAGHGQIYWNRKDTQSSAHGVGTITSNGNDRKPAAIFHRPVESNVQPVPPIQKKSWRQLFTRSSVSLCSNLDTAQGLDANGQQVVPNNYLDSDINLGQHLPFDGYPSLNYSRLGNNCVQKHSRKDSVLDDADVFEDPCFLPDSATLLRPVSKPLDNFPLDAGTRPLKNQPFLADVSKPSPIESPLSRMPRKPSQDVRASNPDDSKNEHGTWQMWGTPLAQDGLGLLGGSNWILDLAQNKSTQGEPAHLPNNPMISHPTTKNQNYSGILSPPGHVPNGILPLQRSLFHQLPFLEGDRAVPFDQMENLARNGWVCDAPNSPTSSNASELSAANCWSKSDCGSPSPEAAGDSPFARRLTGSPFESNLDLELLWFN